MWPLMQEHGYLGASIVDGRVMSYLNETPVDEALEGACVADLSGNLYRFLSGDVASSLVEALCAGRKLPVSSCAFSAVLTGDGALVSAPLVVRGGEHEYMLLDAGPRREALGAWLGFVHSIDKDGRAPYASVTVEQADELLVPLLVCGARAEELVSDYTADQALPAAGEVSGIAFDGVPCVLARPSIPCLDAFIVFAPPAFAVRLFRSFLSFAYANPIGMASLDAILGRLPWSSVLGGDDRVQVGAATLAGWGILRPEADYIGARGLS